MLVLIGDQGLGKSMGMANLCHDPTWFTDDLGCDLFDRKSGEGLQAKWLVEFSEFSRINRATLDVAKAFITRRADRYRPPYGRISKDFPRTCIFIGTTNDDHPLHDRENRRFMPIHCVKADVAWIVTNREQLWAEAVTRYRQGIKWWVTDTTLIAAVTEKQEEARQGDFWEQLISEFNPNATSITMHDVLCALKLDASKADKSTQTRIGILLKSMGYTRKQVRDGQKRHYEWERPS
jgi:predicted P-loop ATPase